VYDFVAEETRSERGAEATFDNAVKAAQSSSEVGDVEHETTVWEDVVEEEDEEEEDLSSLD